jgi:hypothetical protein
LWLKIGSREKQSLEEVEMVDGHLLPLEAPHTTIKPFAFSPFFMHSVFPTHLSQDYPISLQQSSENISSSKINGAGDGGLSCAKQFSCLFDAISILLHSWQKAHPCCSIQRWGLKGRKCCSCTSFSGRTVMSPAAGELHNTIYDPSILDIQISSLKSGNLTVKLQHLF